MRNIEPKPQKWKPPELISAVLTDWLIYCPAYQKPVYFRTLVQRFKKSLPENVKTIEQIEKAHVEKYVMFLLRECDNDILQKSLSCISAFLRWMNKRYNTSLIKLESHSRLRKPKRKKKKKGLRILKAEGKPDSNVLADWRVYCQHYKASSYYYRPIITGLVKSLPETVQAIEQISTTHIENFIVLLLRKYSTKTITNYLSGIRGFLRWVSEEYETPLITIERQSNLRRHRLSLPKPVKPPKPVNPKLVSLRKPRPIKPRRTPTPKILPVLKVEGKPGCNAIEEWFNHIRSLSPTTQDYYRRVITLFLKFLPEDVKGIEQLCTAYIEQYIDNLFDKYKKSHINNHVSALKGFHKWLARNYGIPNHGEKVRKLRPNTPYQPFINRQQYEAILASAKPLEADVIQFLAHTGLRVSEFAKLRFENINENFSSIRFSGKGDKVRTAPLNSIAREILKRHSNGEQLIKLPKSRRYAYNLCSDAGKRAEIYLAPHVLRRYYASSLVERGVSLLIVSKLLGHASIQTTERYLKVDASYLNGATDILVEEPEQERGAELCL